MHYNLNVFDIVIRLIAAMLIIVAGAWTSSFIPMIVGVVLIVTALAGHCPIYAALGTKKKDLV